MGQIAQAPWRRVVVLVGLGLPAPAFAGAWTEPQGQGLLIQTLSGWAGAGSPYGGASAPRESKVETQTYFEYGLWDRLTLFGDVGAMRYGLGPPEKDAFVGLDYSGGGLRVGLWSDEAWSFALEASVHASSASETWRPAQNGDTGREAEARALAGRNLTLFGAKAFLDAEAAYRVRTQGPPDEFHLDLTLGFAVAPRAQIFVQSFNTISRGGGSPGFSAWESHKGGLSLVYALDERWSLQVGGYATLWRRQTNSEYGALLAVWRKF